MGQVKLIMRRETTEFGILEPVYAKLIQLSESGVG